MRVHIIIFLFLACCSLAHAADKQKSGDDDWMQTYYLHPSPERFEEEVKKIQAEGGLRNENARAPVAAFFSRLFVAAEPATLEKWLKFVDELPPEDQTVFLVALHWADTREARDALKQRASKKSPSAKRAKKLLDSEAPKLDKVSNPSPGELDMSWGAFFATGEAVYALTVIRCAAQTAKPNQIDVTHQAARWSLKSLCASHPKLRTIKDDFYKSATPAEQKSLDELFNKK